MSDSHAILNATPANEPELACPACGCGVLIRQLCKSLCERCGYVESCEDIFVSTQTSPSEFEPPSNHARSS